MNETQEEMAERLSVVCDEQFKNLQKHNLTINDCKIVLKTLLEAIDEINIDSEACENRISKRMN